VCDGSTGVNYRVGEATVWLSTEVPVWCVEGQLR